MICAVTAGPTYEPLDAVRRLTNFSTGELGTQLANYLAGRGHDVILLRGNSSIFRGALPGGRIIEFGTTAELEQRLESLAGARLDAVFHAAAVSDFSFGKVWTRAPGGELIEIRKGKFSSRDAPMFAELIPVPKLLVRLRHWFPQAWLVGWKYEVDGDRTTTWERAREQISGSETDACVVNGTAYGPGFGLLRKTGELLHLQNSNSLFECLEAMMPR